MKLLVNLHTVVTFKEGSGVIQNGKLTVLHRLNGDWTTEIVFRMQSELESSCVVHLHRDDRSVIVLEHEWSKAEIQSVIPGVAFEHRVVLDASDNFIPFKVRPFQTRGLLEEMSKN